MRQYSAWSCRTKNMILCSMFVALIALGAFIKIPLPFLPFTLQYLFTMLSGLLLGANLGFASVCVYIILGLSGMPIFAQGGGIGYIFQPSFGYIIGFAVGAYVTGRIAQRKKPPRFFNLLLANFAGMLTVYGIGMVYYFFISNFYLGNPIGVWSLFLYCFVLIVPSDIFLCIIGAILGKRIIPLINQAIR